MRRTSNLATLFLSSVVLLACAITCVAQNREKFVISAKAGGINAITGQASIHGRGESDWQQLMITDDLQAGDRVRTDSDGRVEILLNPGSYLRVGGDSEVELADNSLANLEVRVIRGTAVVEATGVEESQMLINISTPHARLAIDRQGLYRLNVIPNDATVLIVRKGRVILGETHTKIKGGNKVVFSATAVSVAKLTDDEKKQEKEVAIERWSQERAETLAKANQRINNRMLTSAFSGADSSDFFFRSFRGSGLWFYNSRLACFTFLPFGYYGFSSPYGVTYHTTIVGGYGYRSGGYTYGAGTPRIVASGNHPVGMGTSSSPSGSMPLRTTPMSSAPSAGNDIEGGRMMRGRNLGAGRP